MATVAEMLCSPDIALGVQLKGGPHLVATLARAGFQFVRPDMMFSAVDWKELDHILRSAQANDIAAIARVPANPWFAGTDNLQVTVEAARAFSLGFDAVQVSVSSADQVAALLEVARDWHRSAAGEYPSDADGLERQQQRIAAVATLVPSIESRTALDQLEDIVSLADAGLTCVFIAATDLAAQLGHPMDYEHPEVWTAIDRIVAEATAHGLAVIANTGFTYRTAQEVAGRIRDLDAHGISTVMVQSAEFVLEQACRQIVAELRTAGSPSPMKESPMKESPMKELL